MGEYIALMPATIEGDYGISFDTELRVLAEVTPADKAPRDRFGQAEYPDSPERVELVYVMLRVLGVGWRELKAGEYDMGAVRDSVIADMHKARAQAAVDAADMKGD